MRFYLIVRCDQLILAGAANVRNLLYLQDKVAEVLDHLAKTEEELMAREESLLPVLETHRNHYESHYNMKLHRHIPKAMMQRRRLRQKSGLDTTATLSNENGTTNESDALVVRYDELAEDLSKALKKYSMEYHTNNNYAYR